MSAENNKTHWMEKWGAFLAGIGTCIIGVGAIIAAYQANDVLDKVLDIQKKSNTINSAVEELQKGNKRIQETLDYLAMLVKDVSSKQIMSQSPALQSPNSSKKEIEEALSVIPSQVPYEETKGIFLYLPADRRAGVAGTLEREKNIEKRTLILEKNLEVFSPSNKLEK